MEIICMKYNYLKFINVACSSYYACSMTSHDCISYARSLCVESGVCAWYWLFTILGECVVSLELGQRPKLRLTVV